MKAEFQNDDLRFMKMALEEAGLALRKGEVPVGAVAVKDGVVLSSAHNLRETLKDPSAHAEILALRACAGSSDSWRLTGVTLYVTKEPCIMCSGAIVNARLERLVYGCRDPKAGGSGSLYDIPEDPRLNHRLKVAWGLLEEECSEMLRNFFRERR